MKNFNILGSEPASTPMTVARAVAVLTEAIVEDEALFNSYRANIAMAYVDEARRRGSHDSHTTIHDIANQAARNFLKSWCSLLAPEADE